MRHSIIALACLCLCACAEVSVHPAPAAAVIESSGVVVQKGDSLYAIARRNGVNVRDLAEANGIMEPFLIHPGQRLRLPGTRVADAPMAPASAQTQPLQAMPPTVRTDPLPDTDPLAEAVAVKAVEAKAAAVDVAKAVKPAAATQVIAWQWPANGTLVNMPSRHDAIVRALDIAGPAGTPVRATAGGQVLYAGDGSPGYERLIVIRHDDGWVSSYAHNRRQLVSEGQRVTAGELIAEMGNVGAVRDMVHFELRHDGELVDPRDFLPER